MSSTVVVGLNEEEDRVRVVFPYAKADVERMQRIPGSRFQRPGDGGPAWLLPMSLTSTRLLRDQFGDRLELKKDVVAWGKKERQREDTLHALTHATEAELNRLKELDPKLHDWMRNYQRAGAAAMATAPFINSDEPGLGKTVQTVSSILERTGGVGRHLIVAPKTSLESVWAEAFEEFTPLPYITISGDDSPEVRQELLDLIEEWFEDGSSFVAIVNPAMVRYELDDTVDKKDWPLHRGKVVKPLAPAYPDFFEPTWTTLVIDEYHKMGLTNPKSNTSKALRALKAEHALLLSGTPMGGKPRRLWAALNFLYPEKFDNEWRWIDEWLETEIEETGPVDPETGERTRKTKKVYGVRESRQEEFDKHLSQYMVRRTKAEVLPELPPKQIIPIWAEMTPKQKQQYETFAANAELKIEEEHLTAAGILAEYARLKQFANAHQKVKHMGNGEFEVRPTMESGKLPHALEILTDRGIMPTKGSMKAEQWGDDQIVMFSQSSKMVDMLCDEWLNDHLGIPAHKITGDIKGPVRRELVRDFQSGKFRVMVVTTTAAGVALTLDKASTGIIFDETWDPDDQTQAEDRLHRASRIHQVMIYYIRMKHTIEELIMETTGGKQITNDVILDLRRRGFKAI